MNGIQSMLPGVVGPLSSMGVDRLKQLFAQAMSPGGASMGVPPLEILGAIEKASQAQELRDAQARVMARMQANQPTVRDEVLGQAYAGGGIVAFNRGGNVQHFSNGANEFGLIANPEAEAMDALRVEQAQKERQRKALEDTYYSLMMQGDPRAAQVKQQLDMLSTRSPIAPATAARQGKSGIADLDVGPSMAPVVRSPAPPSIKTQRRQPAAPAPIAPSLVTTATPANLTPEMAKAMQEQEDRLRGRLTRPESLTKAEEGLAALAKANIEAQQAEAKTYGEEIRAARDAALARSQRDILSDPMSLLALAGSIDTRKGQGVGSLARGAAGLMGEREKQAEAARKEFALAQRDERAMQANIRQTQMLEAQRQVALEKGKLDEVNAINDQLSKLAIDREQFRLTRGDVAFQQAMKGREVTAEERKARAAEISASKPDAATAMLQEFYRNPEGVTRYIEASKGLEDRAAFARLRQQSIMLQNELKEALSADPLGKSPRVAQLRTKLDSIYQQLGGETPTTGGPVTAPAGTSRPTSKAEFDALPKGARYINPADGKEYIKN